ncbi:hypothetical protein APT22_23150, partial [Escherichia coli]|uniref:hypothetical protein n=1 Tax=Escherichia coli TaxID=562 RepID=UPI000DF14D55
EKRVFLVILFTSFSGSLVSRIPGAVQSANLTPTPTKVKHSDPKSAFMCRMPEFSSEYFDDLPAYILDTETMLMGINRKNRNVNDYNRAISGN